MLLYHFANWWPHLICDYTCPLFEVAREQEFNVTPGVLLILDVQLANANLPQILQILIYIEDFSDFKSKIFIEILAEDG